MQSSLLFSLILKMKFQWTYRCNHWSVFNKDCSEKRYSRIKLFCSSGPNSWKILCILASVLFQKLTLSDSFRSTFKDFEQGFMIAILSGCFEYSKNHCKNEPNDDCEIYYQCNIKTVKLLKRKKKWDRPRDLK